MLLAILRAMKKAVLFDLDGTILDTTLDIGLALETALDTHFEEKQVMTFIGNGLRNAVKNAMTALGMEITDAAIDSYKKKLDIAYRQVPVKYTKAYPTVMDTLKVLQDKGIALGVFSNKDQDLVRTILPVCLPGIDFCFQVGWGGSYEPKPSSDAVLGFCKQVGIDVSELLYVGDSEVDFKTAVNSNADYRILTWGQRPVESLLASGIPQDRLIDTLDIILKDFQD